jgi:hypothetical protein
MSSSATSSSAATSPLAPVVEEDDASSIMLTDTQLSYFTYKTMKVISQQILGISEDIGLFGGGVRDFLRHSITTQKAMKEAIDAGTTLSQTTINKVAVVPEDLDFYCFSNEAYNQAKTFIEKTYRVKFRRGIGRYSRALFVETTKIPIMICGGPKISIDIVRLSDAHVDMQTDFNVNGLIQTKHGIRIFDSYSKITCSSMMRNINSTIEIAEILKDIQTKTMRVLELPDYKDQKKISKIIRRCNSMTDRGWTVISLKGEVYKSVQNQTCPCGFPAMVQNVKGEPFCSTCFDLFDQIPKLDKQEECPICSSEMENVLRPLSCGHWCHRECQLTWGTSCSLCRQHVRFSPNEQRTAVRNQRQRERERQRDLAQDPYAV